MMGQVRIDEMFAFTTVDADGTEGVISIPLNGAHMPLVGADMARVESLKAVVVKLGLLDQIPNPITIKRFTSVEIIDTISRP